MLRLIDRCFSGGWKMIRAGGMGVVRVALKRGCDHSAGS
jgi:hypothetical protein